MDANEIKTKLAKKATGFTTGGLRPTNSASESWISRVYLYKEDERIPTDEKGNLMFPMLQLYLDNFPFVPDILKDTKVITVFISADLPMDVAPNGKNWFLREYKDTGDLLIKDLKNLDSPFKPFPLTPQFIEADFPVWDGCDIPAEIADEILKLEDEGVIDDYFEDIADVQNSYNGHKVGGYPDFCQSGISFGIDFEFAIQIASDEKAHINIVDDGNIYLSKNAKTGDWKFYCDFY